MAPQTSQLIFILLLIFCLIKSNANDITCDGTQECREDSLTCNSGEYCNVYCTGCMDVFCTILL